MNCMTVGECVGLCTPCCSRVLCLWLCVSAVVSQSSGLASSPSPSSAAGVELHEEVVVDLSSFYAPFSGSNMIQETWSNNIPLVYSTGRNNELLMLLTSAFLPV